MPRRLIALFLALLLPLQFAWGAAAVHCQHETATAGAPHFGHHAHQHDAGAKKPVDGKLHIDTDCGYCNAATPHAVALDEAGLPALAPIAYTPTSLRVTIASAPLGAPDRPQWRRLA